MTRVLIVEDDASMAGLLQEALQAGGYFVVGVARTVEEALDTAARHHVDFAVVDIYLADNRLGTEFGLHLRTKTTNAGVVFSTGTAHPSLTLREGDAVMTKPYPVRDMIQALRILADIDWRGATQLKYPLNFRLLGPAAAEPSRQ